jgi:di/tricarboxylate transporter
MDLGTVQMIAVFALIVISFVLYASDAAPLEVTSLGVLCALLILFQLAPVSGVDGVNRLGAVRLLSGFANPALIAVLALLVIGDALERTGALDRGAALLLHAGRGSAHGVVFLSLGAVLLISAVMNNIPVVVIFIPIMQAVATRLNRTPSRLMMPLSFAAMLGGMTTLIGSSTNLLVSSALVDLGERPFGFFDFTIPGLLLAGVGLVYLLTIAPRILPDRTDPLQQFQGDEKWFVAQITLTENSTHSGETIGEAFSDDAEIRILMVQRDERSYLPTTLDFTLEPGDVLVVNATRKALLAAAKGDPSALHPVREDSGDDEAVGRWNVGNQMLTEAMVTPNSGLLGRTLEEIHFRDAHHCVVLGIERNSHVLRQRLTEIPLAAGDVLLIQGQRDDVQALRGDHDIVLMEWSAENLPATHHAKSAGLIFFLVVGFAATGLLPIAVSALAGAVGMVAAGVVNVREAVRALDRQLVFLIASALALGAALQETGGADFLANSLLLVLGNAPAPVVLSAFFLLVALLSNILSTKATAVLFTPIAVGIAHAVGAPVEPFAVAVVFAANCAFASPIGYQTNLLVMGPGHYKFSDFIRVGSPLIILLWIVFSLFAPWWYSL